MRTATVSEILLDVPADRAIVVRDGESIRIEVERDGERLIWIGFPIEVVKVTGSELIRERFPWIANMIRDRLDRV